MRPISPWLAGLLCMPAPLRSVRAAVRRALAPALASTFAVGALWVAGACHHEPPPVAPGAPIAAPTEVDLGSMDAECEALLTALGHYKQCTHLDDDDRADIDAWGERARQDFAAGKKASPEPNAQRAIAAACHKAVASVTAATERCQAGPRPKD